MREDEKRWDPTKTLERCSSELSFVKKLGDKLTEEQKQKFQKSFEGLDMEFLLEKAELIKDTMSVILRQKKTSTNPLLQRNIWSSFDAIALHLDYTGFTRVFQEVAPIMFKDTRLDDTNIISLESQLLADYLGDEKEVSEFVLASGDINEVFKIAEKEKQSSCGMPNIARQDFSFKEAFAKFCGRPTGILEVSHHSAAVAKVVAIILIAVVNLAAGALGSATWFTFFGPLVGGLIFVVTIITVLIIGACGC